MACHVEPSLMRESLPLAVSLRVSHDISPLEATTVFNSTSSRARWPNFRQTVERATCEASMLCAVAGFGLDA